MPKTLSNLDLNKNEIKNVVVHKSSTAPSSPTEGQIYYNTADKNFYRYNGTSWVTYQGEITANGILQGDGNGNITATSTESATLLSIDSAPTASSNNLVTSGGVYTAIQNIGSGLPSQTGNDGKFLTTDGTDASWANIPSDSNKQDKITANGILKGNGSGTITAATAGTDYQAPLTAGTDYATPAQIPSATTTTPKVDGTAAVGSETTWAKGDHVHPTDTSRQATITASGILKGNGSGTISAAVAGTDYQSPLVAGTDYATPAQIPSVPTAYTSNPAMNGTASAGSSTNWAKGDHVHPVDTSRQAQIYTDTITTTTTWTGSGPYTQTVTLANYTATSNSKVDLQPNSTVIGQLVTDGVTALYVSNTSGTLTLNAIGAAPSTAMTLQVSITEVSAAT